MAGIYDADIYCDDCIDDLKDRIARELWSLPNAETPDGCKVKDFKHFNELDEYLRSMDEQYYDSSEYPKYCSDDEESDCPQHCGSQDFCINAETCTDGTKVGAFLGNDLTSDGEDYVVCHVREALDRGETDSVPVEIWMPHYDYLDYGDRPEPEDFTIAPCAMLGVNYALGRVNGTWEGEFLTLEEALEAAKAIMEKEQFWPNVWIISDHGNWSLCDEVPTDN